jgi:hypothetical protein
MTCSLFEQKGIYAGFEPAPVLHVLAIAAENPQVLPRSFQKACKG